jgi:NAD(P)-dependent dehydrogenase (short-subunit alcohol dehydrogenase family)
MRGSTWQLRGKSVLITGAAEGIGAATARCLSARQARLSLVDVQGDTLHQLALDLGRAAFCQQVDITQPEALEAAVAATVDRFGQLDVVVVNAGVVTVGSVERGDPQAFERVIKVNLLGAWQTVRSVLPHVIEASGYILFVSPWLERFRDHCTPRIIAARLACRRWRTRCVWRLRGWGWTLAPPMLSTPPPEPVEARWNTP